MSHGSCCESKTAPVREKQIEHSQREMPILSQNCAVRYFGLEWFTPTKVDIVRLFFISCLRTFSVSFRRRATAWVKLFTRGSLTSWQKVYVILLYEFIHFCSKCDSFLAMLPLNENNVLFAEQRGQQAPARGHREGGRGAGTAGGGRRQEWCVYSIRERGGVGLGLGHKTKGISERAAEVTGRMTRAFNFCFGRP